MQRGTNSCSHPEGLRVVAAGGYRCPLCEARLDGDGLARWVREAERARDAGFEAHSTVEGDEFVRISHEEHQREVYRRRKVMYETQDAPGAAVARPEMLLVIHDPERRRYECRIFYKEPRPVGGTELVSVDAAKDRVTDEISKLLSHADPNVRLAAGKVEELHLARSTVSEDEPAPARRVFYANDL